MNKNGNETQRKKRTIDKRIKDFLLLGIAAITLLFVAGKVFSNDEKNSVYVTEWTATEERVVRLLNEMDGVGEAEVIVYETEKGVESVVVVCEGASSLKVSMNVREAVSAALGVEEKSIKIYLKKE